MNMLEGMKEYLSDHSVGIILLHAYTGSPADVNLLARKLNREGYGVLCPLFRGHDDPHVENLLSVTVETWANQTQAAVEYMQVKYEQVLIFGLSMGGIFATWAMSQSHFNLQAGGVFNSPVITPSRPNLDNAFTRYAKTLYSNLGKESEFEADYSTIMERHHHQLDLLNDFIESFSPQLANITQPFYIAQSLKDELIDSRSGKLLRDRLVQAPVAYHDFPENSHVITVNRNRQDLEDSLIHFIDQHTD